MTSLIRGAANGLLKFSNQTAVYRVANFKPYFNYDQYRSAGHAKWQNIKHTKLANDVAKGKMISRFVVMVRKAIISEKRCTDPRLNSKLAAVLSDAAKANVPKATLERAIARAADVKMTTVNLEIQGPGMSSIIVRCETDNQALLRREVKKAIKKFDAAIMPSDSIINMFKSEGFVRAESRLSTGKVVDADLAEEAAIESNAEEVQLEPCPQDKDDESNAIWVFKTSADQLDACRGMLEKQGFVVVSSEAELVPYRYIDFGATVAEQVVELEKILRELDQVLEVFHNVEL